MSTASQSGRAPRRGAGKSSNPDAIQREVEETRQALGDTAEALAEKARAGKDKVEEVGEDAKAQVGRATEVARRRPVPLGAIGAAVAGLLILRRSRRKRRQRRQQKS